jgi:DUF2934 family protein
MSRQTTEILKRSGSVESVNPEHGQIESLAYQLWLERGAPVGSPEDDRYRAEDQLKQPPAVQRAA